MGGESAGLLGSVHGKDPDETRRGLRRCVHSVVPPYNEVLQRTAGIREAARNRRTGSQKLDRRRSAGDEHAHVLIPTTSHRPFLHTRRPQLLSSIRARTHCCRRVRERQRERATASPTVSPFPRVNLPPAPNRREEAERRRGEEIPGKPELFRPRHTLASDDCRWDLRGRSKQRLISLALPWFVALLAVAAGLGPAHTT